MNTATSFATALKSMMRNIRMLAVGRGMCSCTKRRKSLSIKKPKRVEGGPKDPPFFLSSATLLATTASVSITTRLLAVQAKFLTRLRFNSGILKEVFVKNRFSSALLALILVAFTVPAFVIAQQKRDQAPGQTGSTSTAGKTATLPATPGRRIPRPR